MIEPKKVSPYTLLASLVATLLLLMLGVVVSFSAKYNLSIKSTRQQNISSVDQLSSAQLPDVKVSPTPSVAPDLTVGSIPNSYVIDGGAHVFQTFNNCGPASLSMVLSFYDQNVSQQELGQAVRPYQNNHGDNDDKSVTLAELALLSKQYGYQAYHRPAGNIKLLEQFVAQDIPVLTRTWLKPGEDIGHYRVVKGYDQSREVLLQDDSLQGSDLEYSYDDFINIWQAFNYEFLVIAPPDKEETVKAILGSLNDKQVAWQMALEKATTQQQQNKNDLYAKFNQVVALYHLGEYKQAIKIYEQVSEQLPSRMLWYQMEPLLSYYQEKQFDQVLSMINQIFNSQNRAFSELYWLRAQIYFHQGKDELAQRELQLANFYNDSDYWRVNLP